MKIRDLFSTAKEKIEKVMPMTFGNFVVFFLILYFITLVTRMTWNNYQSNKSIDAEGQKIDDLTQELTLLRYQISYYKTNSFKEKEAREKLAYKAPGEQVLMMPLDTPAESVADEGNSDPRIKIPNQHLWRSYFFK
ncbi:MAG: hypothetical protein AAB881_01430 [Patescibacteria group bacterium]